MTTQPQTPDPGVIKGRQQKTWSTGDYTRIGNPLVIMGEQLCEAVNVRSGQKIQNASFLRASANRGAGSHFLRRPYFRAVATTMPT